MAVRVVERLSVEGASAARRRALTLAGEAVVVLAPSVAQGGILRLRGGALSGAQKIWRAPEEEREREQGA
jgi:hypothetical protein